MDGLYQLVIGGVNAKGQFAQNVFHYQVAGTTSEDEYGTAGDLNSAFFATIVPDLQHVMGTDCKLNILYSKFIGAAGGASIFQAINAAGEGSGVAFSNVVACDIAFYPGGAKNRPGHTFTWGAYIGGIIGDVIQSTLLTALGTLATDLVAGLALTTGTATFGTYTRKTKAFTPATHWNVKPKITGLNKRTLPLY